MKRKSESQPDLLVPFQKLETRYNKTSRTIENYLQDEDLGFPKPVFVQGRSYFRLSDLQQFEGRFLDKFGAGEAAEVA